MKNVYNNILECVGNTPLVRLNSLTKGLKCTVYAKVEFFNPAGSLSLNLLPAFNGFLHFMSVFIKLKYILTLVR